MFEIAGVHKVEIHQRYLECTEGGSNKFYRILVISNKTTDKASVVITYGPIGRAGQTSIHSGYSINNANSLMRKKYGEKEKKGYVPLVSKSPIRLGLTGGLTHHTFGQDSLADKEVAKEIENAIGKTIFEQIKLADEWGELKEPSAQSKKEAETEKQNQAEIESERANQYETAWGAWA